MYASGGPDRLSLTGDVETAYGKSHLGGEAVYGDLPRQIRPKDWDPGDVAKIEEALYGLKRSGLDWGEKVGVDATKKLG